MSRRNLKGIALERIRILFNEAEKAYIEYPDRAQRYIELARKIAMRSRVHIPSHLRRMICRGCKSYLHPKNSWTRIRQTREPHVATTCKLCGHVNRYPLRSREK